MSIKGTKQTQVYVYDFAVDGGATGAIDLSAKANAAPLPTGAVITSVYGIVTTAFTSGGSATMSWGPTSDVDGYSGTAIAVASLTDNLVVNGWDSAAALLWDDTNDHAIFPKVIAANTGDFLVTIATAAMTAGYAEFVVEYYMPINP